MEMISYDIIQSLRGNPLLASYKTSLWHILELADLVKFAKEMPLPNENEQSLADTRKFIQETRPAEFPEKQLKTESELPATT
jgi:hypothetical protein